MFKYTKSMIDDFRFPFDGLDKIEESYAQALQDMFVLATLNGKHNGTFLEVGAYAPEFISNTVLLEKQFGWTGISIDYDGGVEPQFKAYGRTAKFITGDATKLDYNSVLSKFENPVIDYLQLDIEPNAQTLECLKAIPFDNFDFRVITFEHDHYSKESSKEFNDAIRKESEEILEGYGYVAVAKNIANVGNDEFESWWLNKKYFNGDIISKFKLNDVNQIILARNYMINGLE